MKDKLVEAMNEAVKDMNQSFMPLNSSTIKAGEVKTTDGEIFEIVVTARRKKNCES